MNIQTKPAATVKTSRVLELEHCLGKASTIENAKKWNDEQDKFLFAFNLLPLFSVSSPASAFWVEELEQRFEGLLAKN
jgi:hypothetical protein